MYVKLIDLSKSKYLFRFNEEETPLIYCTVGSVLQKICTNKNSLQKITHIIVVSLEILKVTNYFTLIVL